MRHIRVLQANPADVKSSTMKGPQGLTGQLSESRCRDVQWDSERKPLTATNHRLVGKGQLLHSGP